MTKISDIPIDEPTRRFNALLEEFDFLTEYRYAQVTSVPAVLYYAIKELGFTNTIYQQLNEAAKECGYDV